MKISKHPHRILTVTALAVFLPLSWAQSGRAADSGPSGQRPINRPAQPSAPVSPTASSRANSAGASANLGTNAAAGAQVNGATVGGATAGQAGIALNTADTATEIRQAGVETREALASSINASIDIAQATGERWERTTKHLEASVRTRFEAAVGEVRTREKALKASLRDARKASAEKWSEAREKLAADYEAFTQSIANAEASVRTASTTRATVSGE